MKERFMVRRVFYGFHYKPDNWRVMQIKNIGAIEGSRLLNSNEWESIKRGGDQAIKRWIDEEMNGTSCLVVLIGQDTANRRWVNYEITKAWNEGKGVVGVYINTLKDQNNRQSLKGQNPFYYIKLENGVPLAFVAKAYEPNFPESKDAFNYISNNLQAMVEEAISIRNNYRI
jgi:hypothetical protein